MSREPRNDRAPVNAMQRAGDAPALFVGSLPGEGGGAGAIVAEDGSRIARGSRWRADRDDGVRGLAQEGRRGAVRSDGRIDGRGGDGRIDGRGDGRGDGRTAIGRLMALIRFNVGVFSPEVSQHCVARGWRCATLSAFVSVSSQPVPLRLGPYELVRRLATGGMAEVYLARRAGPHGFQKTVAVKRVLPQLARDPNFLAMFVDEARVCARLCHPNIVQVFDFGEHEGELYMAMEYVDGTTGARLIRAAAARREALSLEVCVHVVLSVLRGLEYAHAARDDSGRPLRLVHRDVSPGNVLIDRSGAVKLTDFGIARAAEIERRTDAGQLKGKLGYMSPEQVLGRELDARTDVFTIGIVLAEMVTLRPLFSGGRELDVLQRIRDADVSMLDRQDLPDDVRQVLYRALAREPDLRYTSAGEFADALEELIRRRRLNVGPARLAASLERLGLTQNETFDAPSTASRKATAVIEQPANKPREHAEDGTTENQVREIAPQVYCVKGAGGIVLGPMSYPRVVELFATGQLTADSMVSRESGAFKLASTYKEFARFVSSPALRWNEPLPTGAITWKIERGRWPADLFQIALSRQTGVLHLSRGAYRKKVFFVEGAPEFVASTDKSELLGAHLVASGRVLRMELDMALAMLPRFGGRLGDALVGLGVLRPVELFRAVHEQTQNRFAEVLGWAAGDVAFVRGVRSQEETFPLGVDSFELIARGVRQGYTPAELSGILEPLRTNPVQPVLHPAIRIESFRMPDREAFVLRRLDTSLVLDEIVDEMADLRVARREEVLRAVFIGLCCGVLQCPAFWDAHPMADSLARLLGR